MYITIRPSLNKVKAWHNVQDAQALYTSLLVNREVLESDLDIYEVTDGSKELIEKLIYGFIENDSKIEFKREVINASVATVTLTWIQMEESLREVLYTQSELDDIAFNLAQPDDTTWRSVPTKERNIDSEVITYEVVQTVSVTKLNPFA